MSEEQFKEMLTKKQILESVAPQMYEVLIHVLNCLHRKVGLDEELEGIILKVLNKAGFK